MFQRTKISIAGIALFTALTGFAKESEVMFTAGHSSLQPWLMPNQPPYPANNEPTPARVELGKTLFFDPRLSGDGSISCASCHNPSLGWSDGLPTGIGFQGTGLSRASPTIINSAYNHLQMWDGRKRSLEHQVMGPMMASSEMNRDVNGLFEWLNNSEGYRALFSRAYPQLPIDEQTLSMAVASFERTIVSKDSPFDRWVAGDDQAMTREQIDGFRVFVGKGNCVACHSAPNFTDDGFHNIGLASWGEPNPDMGRYLHKPIRVLKGAFKTPTIRDISRTAPYFHDGSAATLREVVEHYDTGGVVREGIDPNMRPLNLTDEEKHALVDFMRALTSPFIQVSLPELPLD